MSSVEPNRWRLLAMAGRLAIPIEVSFELTHRCNFRCLHCFIPDFAAPDLLSTERILGVLDELASLGTMYLALTGGEVMLRPDWYPIARRARELGFSVRILTNGSLVDATAASRIAEICCGVEVSLYSMSPGTFDEVTGVRGSFERTLQAVRLLRERGVDVLLKLPVTRFNANGHDEVFAFARSVGAACRADARIVSRKDGHPSPLAARPSPDQARSFYGGPYAWCALPEEVADPRGDRPMCAAGNRYANITASGDVQACNILPGSAGNVRRTSFRAIWEDSPWLQKIRAIRRRDLPTCGACRKLAYCGRCHAQALVEDGNLVGSSRWACEHAERVEAVALARKAPLEEEAV